MYRFYFEKIVNPENSISDQCSMHVTTKRRVSCISYIIIHTRWALKNTRYIHEVGGIFTKYTIHTRFYNRYTKHTRNTFDTQNKYTN